MRWRLELRTNSAEFQADPAKETVRVLRLIVDQVKRYGLKPDVIRQVVDRQGHTIGAYLFDAEAQAWHADAARIAAMFAPLRRA